MKRAILFVLVFMLVGSALAIEYPEIDYYDLQRNPDNYVGNSLYTARGEVIAVAETVDSDFKLGKSPTRTILCIQPDVQNAGPFYVHYFRQWGEPRILVGDYIVTNAAVGGLSVYAKYEVPSDAFPPIGTLPILHATLHMTVNGEPYPPDKE